MTYKKDDLVLPKVTGVADAFRFNPDVHGLINDNDNYRLATDEEVALYESGTVKRVVGAAPVRLKGDNNVANKNAQAVPSNPFVSDMVNITDDLQGNLRKWREFQMDDMEHEQRFMAKVMLNGKEGADKLNALRSIR